MKDIMEFQELTIPIRKPGQAPQIDMAVLVGLSQKESAEFVLEQYEVAYKMICDLKKENEKLRKEISWMKSPWYQKKHEPF